MTVGQRAISDKDIVNFLSGKKNLFLYPVRTGGLWMKLIKDRLMWGKAKFLLIFTCRKDSSFQG